MRAEEERLLALRTATADRSQHLASLVTIAGSALVILLAAISILLVRRSAHARDEAEARLRENNLNLEATVDARTADLREANDEIQRFAYIVSHDLRSPLAGQHHGVHQRTGGVAHRHFPTHRLARQRRCATPAGR